MKGAGITVRMVTGDQKATAVSVAKTIGLILDDDENNATLAGEELNNIKEADI